MQEALTGWGRAMQHELGGRLTRSETIHLTLAFVGEVSASRILALRNIGEVLNGAAFDLEIDCVGCWAHNGVAWAGSTAAPQGLSNLVTALRDKLNIEGFAVESRAFATHVTLLRKAACAPLKWQPPRPLVWAVRRLVLVRSALGTDGSTYSELASWPLG